MIYRKTEVSPTTTDALNRISAALIELELNTKFMTKLEAITTLIQGLDVEEKKKLLNELDIELNYPQFEEQLVRSWEEAIKKVTPKSIAYISSESKLMGEIIGNDIPITNNKKNRFRTHKEAIAYGLAAAQLSQIVADANGDWVADWTNIGQAKYCIFIRRVQPFSSKPNALSMVVCEVTAVTHFPMATKEIAEACLEKHRTLWEQFWMV